jgi:ligand-binding SRPBCC domain-containing protein
MRVGVVLAAMGGALDQMLPLFRAGVGGKLGSGRQWMSWIHLQDLVSLVVHAIQTPSLSGPINAVAPHPLRNADFSKALARAVGKSALLPAPGFALKLALGEMSQMILGGQRVRPAQALESGFVFQFPTLEDALGDLAPGDEVFESLQWIPKKVEEVFPFFSEAKNLETLTPELLQFKIVAQSTPEIQEGTLIDYQLKVHGIPMHWRTRIEEWKPGVQFVDTQLKGPYSRWHHNHRFESLQGGTLLSDRVLYRLPGGGMGSLMAGSKVRSDVRQIFEYRREKIEKLFGRI